MSSTATLNASDAPRAERGAHPPIDLVHLARSTLGDRSLEREVLALFARQAGVLLERMRQADPKTRAAHAHTLKGSARGIGAWEVATAAECVEAADAGAEEGMTALSARIADADKFIADLLRAH